MFVDPEGTLKERCSGITHPIAQSEEAEREDHAVEQIPVQGDVVIPQASVRLWKGSRTGTNPFQRREIRNGAFESVFVEVHPIRRRLKHDRGRNRTHLYNERKTGKKEKKKREERTLDGVS